MIRSQLRRLPVMGLLVLSSDETCEHDLRTSLPVAETIVHTARVTNAPTVEANTLAAMRDTLTPAAASLPPTPEYAVVGYGCTSATAVLGAQEITRLVRDGCKTRAVTTPLDGLIAKCEVLSISRLGLVSPYITDVSDRLVAALEQAGLQVPSVTSFGEPSEPAVARITDERIVDAAQPMLDSPAVDAVFLSCTNLPTCTAIDRLSRASDKLVLSSNSVLAWDMRRHAGLIRSGEGHDL